MVSESRKAAFAAGLDEDGVKELERGGWNFGGPPVRWSRGLQRNGERVAFQQLTPVGSGGDATWRIHHENFENDPGDMSSAGRIVSDLDGVSFAQAVRQAAQWQEGDEVVSREGPQIIVRHISL